MKSGQIKLYHGNSAVCDIFNNSSNPGSTTSIYNTRQLSSVSTDLANPKNVTVTDITDSSYTQLNKNATILNSGYYPYDQLYSFGAELNKLKNIIIMPATQCLITFIIYAPIISTDTILTYNAKYYDSNNTPFTVPFNNPLHDKNNSKKFNTRPLIISCNDIIDLASSTDSNQKTVKNGVINILSIYITPLLSEHFSLNKYSKYNNDNKLNFIIIILTLTILYLLT